ncbi:hypothetical protein [Amycolatopsis eburnea]|nr:hypothetical protein [Amycolatopsis eburnea]
MRRGCLHAMSVVAAAVLPLVMATASYAGEQRAAPVSAQASCSAGYFCFFNSSWVSLGYVSPIAPGQCWDGNAYAWTNSINHTGVPQRITSGLSCGGVAIVIPNGGQHVGGSWHSLGG